MVGIFPAFVVASSQEPNWNIFNVSTMSTLSAFLPFLHQSRSPERLPFSDTMLCFSSRSSSFKNHTVFLRRSSLPFTLSLLQSTDSTALARHSLGVPPQLSSRHRRRNAVFVKGVHLSRENPRRCLIRLIQRDLRTQFQCTVHPHACVIRQCRSCCTKLETPIMPFIFTS